MSIAILDEQKHTHPLVLIQISEGEIEAFKHLVQRAMNTWQDAPLSMREFADILLVGHVRQDYTPYAK